MGAWSPLKLKLISSNERHAIYGELIIEANFLGLFDESLTNLDATTCVYLHIFNYPNTTLLQYSIIWSSLHLHYME